MDRQQTSIDYPNDEQTFCCAADVETLSNNDVATENFLKNVL